MNKTIAVSPLFSVTKICLVAIPLALALFVSTSVYAQATTAGCDPRVKSAMDAKAQAKVAYDVAVTEQVVVKPDSVLAMTCFNRSAGVSAERGGNIFSGSFLGNANFASVITDALSAMFLQFADAEGKDNYPTDFYALTAPEDEAECSGIEELWTLIKEKGIAGAGGEIPYITMDELMSGTLPGGVGERFQRNWDTAAGTDFIFQNLNTEMTGLPTATVVDFGAADSLCGVLTAAGVPC